MYIIHSLSQLNIEINLKKLEIEILHEFFFYKMVAFGLKITEMEKNLEQRFDIIINENE